MNVRLDGDYPQPVKFVLDGQARTPLTAKILQGAPCTIYVSTDAPFERVKALEDVGAEVRRMPTDSVGRLDLHAVVRDIGSRQINVLHVEAGATLNGALLVDGLIDEVVAYVAPIWMGKGLEAAVLPEFERLDQALRWNFHRVDRIGPDVRLVLRKQAPNRVDD